MELRELIQDNKRLKEFLHWAMVPVGQARPRLWVQLFINPFFHKKGKRVVVRRRTRMDVFPWNVFDIGSYSTIEDFTTVNNGVGDVMIGINTRIGLGNTIIGPVSIENDVRLAQNVVLSGLNHNYQDISRPIHEQGVSTAKITIGEASWVGANVTIVAGVTVGKHCIIAAGSVVTKDIPSYSVAVGNPARVIKQFNHHTGVWESLTKKEVVTA